MMIVVKYVSFANPDGTLADGYCCDNSAKKPTCPPDNCDVAFQMCATRDPSTPCDTSARQTTPTTFNDNSFSFGSFIGNGIHTTPNLVASQMEYKPGDLTFDITAVDRPEEGQLGLTLTQAAFPFTIDWVDPVFAANPHYRRLTLNDTSKQLVVDVASMCTNHYYTADCSVYCKPEPGFYTCLDDGTPKYMSASALKMEMTPQNYTDAFDSTVEISCYTNKIEATVKDMVILEIGRKGDKPLAIIHQDETIVYPNSDKAYLKLQAVGYITNDKSQHSYLNLSLTEPRKGSDEGLYECTMYYLNEAGKVESTIVGRTLSVIDPDVPTLGRVLQSMVSKVERLNAQIKTLTDAASGAEETYNGTLFVVKKTFNIDLMQRTTQKAVLVNSVVVEGGEGLAGDGKAEVFIAPKAGLYTFDLALQAEQFKNYYIEWAIQYNGTAQVSAVLEVDHRVPRSASTSLTLCLSQGEKIENVISRSGFTVIGATPSPPPNPVVPVSSRFSGYFVRPCQNNE